MVLSIPAPWDLTLKLHPRRHIRHSYGTFNSRSVGFNSETDILLTDAELKVLKESFNSRSVGFNSETEPKKGVLGINLFRLNPVTTPQREDHFLGAPYIKTFTTHGSFTNK